MRLTDLLQTETETKFKRLSKRAPFVAHIDVDGNVELQHCRHETMYLDSRDELQDFIEENNLGDMAVLVVDIVNAQGAEPESK